ncbi:MAG: TIGR04255 family protein [Desulforhopalus sp.]
MGKPVKGKHAIEVAVFTITLQKEMSKHSVDALMTLKESLKEQYPVFNTVNRLAVRIEKDLVQNEVQTVSGVNLQQQDGHGKVLWTLRASDDSVAVSCFDYERWEKISDRAFKNLLFVLSVIADDQNPITTIGLQYVDRFVGQADNYKLNQVFNTKSRFFTKQTMQSGSLWHIYQGWFQEIEGYDGKHLNVLNLSTNDTQLGLITTIDHTSRIHFSQLIPVTHITEEFVSPLYQLLHDCNKSILIDLLNAKQRKDIKLSS